jgi:ribulose-phosphate 3-epimerase
LKIEISASILSADFGHLAEQVQSAAAAGVDRIHIDVMDGHFVPNLTIGPLVVEALQGISRQWQIPLDVHLMIAHPESLIPAFANAGADYLTVHVETCPHIHRTIQMIRELGVKPGVTLNPATPLSSLEEIVAFVDEVLIMSVNPGFGGQTYIPESASRITRLRHMLDAQGLTQVDIAVDGGIKSENIAQVVAAGANIVVVGSGIYNQSASIAENVAALRRAILPRE